MKRKIAICLLLAAILALSPFTSFADWENTYENTSDYAMNIVGVAQTQIGYTSDGISKYAERFYLDEDDAWSGAFVVWCAEQAGLTSQDIVYNADCESLLEWFEEKGLITLSSSESYTPSYGDIVFLISGSTYTTGIVKSVDGSTVTVIEGDYNDSVSENEYSIDDESIYAYGTPDYANVSGYVIGIYTVTASVLNFRSGPGTEYETVKDDSGNAIRLTKGTSVTVTAVSGGWGYIKYSGKYGWIALYYAEISSSELPASVNSGSDVTEKYVQWNVIDVSRWNDDIDWTTIAAQDIQAAIIRIGGRYSVARTIYEDALFFENYSAAAETDLYLGCYFYTTALTVEQAVEEAEFVIEMLETGNCQMTMPIYMDIEDDCMRKLGKSMISAIADAFCSTLEDAGYYAGIYCSKSWAESYLTDEVLEGRAIWIAQWEDECAYEGDYGMWQYTDSGKILGIDGYTDLNLCYINYPYYITQNGLNGFTATVSDTVTYESVYDGIENEELEVTVTTVAPTCTEYGSITKTITSTGEVIYEEILNPTGHTATQVGSDGVVYCSECWEALLTAEEHAGHAVTLETVTSGTCLEAGTAVITCTDCGEALGEIEITGGHAAGETQSTTVSCETDGSEEIYCSVCGERIFLELTLATGHTVTEWIQMSVADEYGTPGIKKGVCDVCGQTVYKSVALIIAGDTDGDGSITLQDARQAMLYALGLATPDEDLWEAADYDGDGEISLQDARNILRAALSIG